MRRPVALFICGLACVRTPAANRIFPLSRHRPACVTIHPTLGPCSTRRHNVFLHAGQPHSSSDERPLLRRSLLQGALKSGVVLGTWGVNCLSARASQRAVVVPLSWREGAFYLRYCFNGSRLDEYWGLGCNLGVADTGSPYLLAARCLREDCRSYCMTWGCFGGQGQPSGDPSTFEGYSSGLIEVEWRQSGSITFPDCNPNVSARPLLKNLKFGVQGRVISMGGMADGVFFGLIRDHMADIRPSFLQQTPYESLRFDFSRQGSESLTFSPSSLVRSRENHLKLVDPRIWGDPVKHYAALATAVLVGGVNVLSPEPSEDTARSRRVLCIFDTGTTGASLTRGLYDAYLQTARQLAMSRRGMKFSEAKRMDVVFQLSNGKELKLDMFFGAGRDPGDHPYYGSGFDVVTPIDEMAWAGIGPVESLANYRVPGGRSSSDRPFDDVMLVGLGFLIGRVVTIDTVKNRLSISERSPN